MQKCLQIILVALLCETQLFSQEGKSVVSFSTGINIKIENTAYIDFDNPDFEIWISPKTHAIYNLSYDYRLNDLLRVGVRLEFEKLNFDSFYTDETSVKRSSVGIQFLAQYPKTSFHAELGGFASLGHISSDAFDNPLSGIENGIIAGPAYTIGQIEMALQFQSSFGYYFLPSNEAPASALIMYPKVMMKVGYIF